jgi:hypothetical protein
MKTWRALVTTLPGRLMRQKRMRFMRALTQAGPRTRRLNKATRLKTSVTMAHQP